MPSQRRRVAIACQGGGSHTAFTAGVLKRLLRPEELGGYEIVGLSGTSGGAICALLAWAAVREDDPARAGELLDRFWTDNSAITPVERWVNAWTLGAAALMDVTVPLVSPYMSAASTESLEQLRQLLLRQLDFAELGTPSDRGPMLLIGAVDVLSGDFKAFNSRRDRITPDVILASAAIPTLFRAVPVDGRLYWDGLFSQNPPVRELIDAQPDEIWVIQINAKEFATEPQTSRDIADRRNELSGNLSLYQELHVIEKIDQLLEEGLLASGGQFRPIVVRVIELVRSRLSRSLGPTSKLNRDVDFIRELMAHGANRADEFLIARAFEDAWRARDVDASSTSSPPMPSSRPQRRFQIGPSSATQRPCTRSFRSRSTPTSFRISLASRLPGTVSPGRCERGPRRTRTRCAVERRFTSGPARSATCRSAPLSDHER